MKTYVLGVLAFGVVALGVVLACGITHPVALAALGLACVITADKTARKLAKRRWRQRDPRPRPVAVAQVQERKPPLRLVHPATKPQAA